MTFREKLVYKILLIIAKHLADDSMKNDIHSIYCSVSVSRNKE